ncbi:12-oxophytodienoate reductase [Microbacterium sp.]|uniref:oxidoreductase n=1 Tax=Microbacterium sp. TaxID=51671 RepID=UPI003C70CA6A
MTTGLNSPLRIRTTELTNRIVLAPMGVGHCEGGAPDEDLRAFYRRRAENNVGLLITGATFIDHPTASNHVLLPSIAGQQAQESWGRIVGDVHAAGAPILLQIEHAGIDRDPAMSLDPTARILGPSGVDQQGRPYGEAMSCDDINEIIAAFAQSARTAEQLGFDGVEVHGAHGFLIDQFIWGRTNTRTDEYHEPSRFAVDVIHAIRASTGPDFIVSFRWSQWKMHDYAAQVAKTPEELERVLRPIADTDIDLFHASTRRWWEPLFTESALTTAGWTKRITGKPTIAVGSVGMTGAVFHSVFQGQGAKATAPTSAVERMQQGEFDLIAVGRPLLGDPEWAAKVLSGRFGEVCDFNAHALAELH